MMLCRRLQHQGTRTPKIQQIPIRCVSAGKSVKAGGEDQPWWINMLICNVIPELEFELTGASTLTKGRSSSSR